MLPEYHSVFITKQTDAISVNDLNVHLHLTISKTKKASQRCEAFLRTVVNSSRLNSSELHNPLGLRVRYHKYIIVGCHLGNDFLKHFVATTLCFCWPLHGKQHLLRQ